MAQYSVILTVFAVSVLIAHSLCFRLDEMELEPVDVGPQARQFADNILVIQAETTPTPPTTRVPLQQRIRDTFENAIRDLGNNVRQTPVRIQECFQNITRCAQTILRRNSTNTNPLQLPSLE